MKTLKPEIRAILDKIKGANACEDFVKNEFEKRNLKKANRNAYMNILMPKKYDYDPDQGFIHPRENGS